MPHDELHHYTYIHEAIAAVMEGVTELASRLDVASAIARRSHDGPDADLNATD
jgi:hypothetical protein